MQKKNIKYILFITLECVILVLLKLYFLNESEIHVELSEQEQEEIKSFYEIEPESISRGVYFDMKYAYLEPAAMKIKESPWIVNDVMVIELVMKNKNQFTVDYIDFYNKDGIDLKPFIRDPFGKEIRTLEETPTGDFVPLYDEFEHGAYQRLGKIRAPLADLWMWSAYFGLDVDLTELRISMDVKDSAFQLFDRRVSNYIVYDEDRRLESTKQLKEKCMSEKCNAYEKSQVRYYFGILYRRDFEKWYTEMKEYVKAVGNPQEYDLTIPFNNPCKREKDKSMQEKLGLEDDQYQKCLEIMDMLEYECELLDER